MLLAQAKAAAPPVDWKKHLHTVDELPEGEPEMIVKGFMSEGITFFGSLAGVAKTWLALALGKSIVNGEKFLEFFDVPKAYPVIYLCPEMGAKSFRKRCKLLGLGGENFRVQTIADGMPLKLTGDVLEAAIKDLKPCVVMLDTAIRFNSAKDENASTENSHGLANAIFNLVHLGAIAIILLHHAPKASAEKKMTLENVLRGTSDIGAIADAVWGLQHDTDDDEEDAKRLGRCRVECVKPRDFEPLLWNFKIQLRPYIDQSGKVAMLEREVIKSLKERFEEAIWKNPRVSQSQLAKLVGVTRQKVVEKAMKCGFWWTPDKDNKKEGTWKDVGPQAG